MIQDEELKDVEGIRPVPGAIEFLRALPRDRWAIVTSAPIELARKRMAAAGVAAQLIGFILKFCQFAILRRSYPVRLAISL